jgi:hypothetical protein
MTIYEHNYAYRMRNANENELRRYTVFVRFTYNNDAHDYCIEEIDVDAYNRKNASEIAKIALDEYYARIGDDNVTRIRIVRINQHLSGTLYL